MKTLILHQLKLVLMNTFCFTSHFQMLQSGQGHQIIQTANGQQIVVQSGQSIQVRYQLASCVKKNLKGTMQKTVTKNYIM
jgi:hypothetical protein